MTALRIAWCVAFGSALIGIASETNAQSEIDIEALRRELAAAQAQLRSSPSEPSRPEVLRAVSEIPGRANGAESPGMIAALEEPSIKSKLELPPPSRGELDAGKARANVNLSAATPQARAAEPTSENILPSTRAGSVESSRVPVADTTQLARLERENASLQRRLNDVQAKNAQLTRELSEARNRLLVAETEVERLSGIAERRAGARASVQPAQPAARPQQAPQQVVRAPSSPTTSDMPFVTVTVEKANLRLGPSATDSPVMTVSRGTRLAVETRQNDWFRVYAPNGTRLWVSSDVVAFGADGQSSPTSTVRVRGTGQRAPGDEFNFGARAQ